MNINTLDDIKRLTENSEGVDIEFKETTGQLERGMETLCAFLNGNGGVILFGVSDNGKIIGQDLADHTKRAIAEAINRLEPLVSIDVAYVSVPNSEKFVIVLYSDEKHVQRPFTYKGRAYHRVESMTTTMPQEPYNQLLMERDGARFRWETFGNNKLQISDLDLEEITKTVRLGIECGRLPETISSETNVILEKLGLLELGVLNNAAAVLFANRELIDYPQCLLRLARFKGTNKSAFIDNQRVQGNIFVLLDAAMAFIFKHLSLSGTIEGMEREEQLAIPYKAIRECIINALCHRQYRSAGGSVGIAIYDDRVEIENFGSFPKDWNLEKMRSEHRSEPTNPIISNVLYKRKLLENWGRGIGLIIDECKKANLPEPEFKTDNGFVIVTYKYRTNIVQVPHKYPTSTPQVPHKYPTSTPQVESLLETIDGMILSVNEMMKKLQLRDRKNFLNVYLNPAIELELVEPIYPDQPRNPKQKYRLTDKGKSYRKQD
jgi:ATP-dependent DNA helicase RecG